MLASKLCAVNGSVPFHSLPLGIDLDGATDLDLDMHSGNIDVAWHAAQAFSAMDHDPPGAEQRTKIEYDREKRIALASRRDILGWQPETSKERHA